MLSAKKAIQHVVNITNVRRKADIVNAFFTWLILLPIRILWKAAGRNDGIVK